jgi:hypothetical protein
MPSGPTVIFADNQGAIKLANNSVFQKRTKNIAVKYHYTRDLIKQRDVELSSKPTDQMIANRLTKSPQLPKPSVMIKNILSIFVFDVEVKRLFSMTKDVIIYRRNRFHEIIIENIMILKKTLNLKKVNKDNHVSLIVDNFLIDDEILESLLNEAIDIQTRIGINQSGSISGDSVRNKPMVHQQVSTKPMSIQPSVGIV